MLRHLIRKEILDQLQSFRFQLIAVLAAVFVLGSVVSGLAAYKDRPAEYQASVRGDNARLNHLINATNDLLFDRF